VGSEPASHRSPEVVNSDVTEGRRKSRSGCVGVAERTEARERLGGPFAVQLRRRRVEWLGSRRMRTGPPRRRHHSRKLALVGSVLRENFGPCSDVDARIEFQPRHVPGLAFFAVERKLSGILNRKVDLNTPSSAKECSLKGAF
jgi:predicted nucleotidyltransferase